MYQFEGCIMDVINDMKVQANALMVQGRFADAITLLNKLYEKDSSDDDTLLRLGVSELKLNNLDRSEEWLTKASELKSTNPACYMYLAHIKTQKQDIVNAIDNYRTAISLQPDLAVAHLHLASLLMSVKQLEDSEYHYNYVINLQPDNANAYANLAQVQELLNKIDEARNSVSKALSITPGHVAALMVLGKIKKRDGEYLDAEKMFEKVISLSSVPALSASASFELGHCLDKLERYNEAISMTIKGKDLVLNSINNLPFDKKIYQSKIEANKNFLKKSQMKTSDKVRGDINDRPAPVFFVGFPRSGTTLVEQILNQHEDIVTSDEASLVDDLINSISEITDTNMPYPQCLDALIDTDYALLREYYWKNATKEIDGLGQHKRLVDKLPLNIVELGFISRLFPNAKILVALRDPRDVCLSCFMQAFTPNPAMINFIDMESTTDFYHHVMDLWLNYRKNLPINWHQYRYEDLIDDFDETTSEIFSFLELDYPENAELFYEAVQDKAIKTPSYQDVATPIYSRSKARWKNYEQYLEPYMDRLAPFINDFGY